MKWLWVLVFLALLLLPVGSVFADTSADITVTYAGYICEAPGGLTVEYISDTEVNLYWTKGADAVNTMVRVKYGSPPTGIDDGYLVYLGTAENTTDSSVVLVAGEQVFYGAWSQNANGVWEVEGVTEEADFMTQSFLFIGLIGLACVLTFMSGSRKNILLTFASSVLWLGLASWLFFSESPVLGLDESFATLIMWVFIIMIFVPIVLHIQYQVKQEVRSKDGTIFSWKDNGGIPKRAPFGTADQYRMKLRERLGNTSGRRPRTKARRTLYGK